MRTNRRQFLQRAAALVPVLHAGGVMAMATRLQHTTDSRGASPDQQPPERFARLRLRTHRLAEMASFYRSLDLPCAQPDDSTLRVTAGRSIIEFARAAGPTEPFYHFAFNIPHNKLNAAIAWLKPRCELVRRPNGEVVFHFQHWDAHAIYFLDPSNNIVEFIARHTLKNDAPGDFGPRDILCASEIGVVTPDVGATSGRLRTELALDTYHATSDTFAAIGDEHGLFIVVKTGRLWFGVENRPAKVFEAEAQLRDGPAGNVALNESSFVVSREAA